MPPPTPPARPNVYWLTQELQRHGAAALRPGRHARPRSSSTAAEPAMRGAAPRLPRLRRPRRLRGDAAAGRRSPRCASRRSPCPAAWRARTRDLGAGLPRPHLRARERREARPPAALRDAGPGLPRARRGSPPTGPTSRRCSPGCAPRPGIDIAETDDPAAAQIRIEAVPAGADRPGLPHRRLLHRAGRDRLAGLPAPPLRRAAALVRTRRRWAARRSSCRSTPRRRTCATA